MKRKAAFHFVFATSALIVTSCVMAPPPTNDDGNNPPDDNQDGEPVWSVAFDATDLGFLSAVWGSSPDDVFTVGGQPDQGSVAHFDGGTWSPMSVPVVPLLVWVFGFGPDDVFSVGEGGGAIHYDGASWQLMDTGTDIDLFGIWGASPDDLWAVGGIVESGPPIILHYDGQSWEERATPPLDRGSTALLKVWGTSSSQVFAIGQTGVIIEFDGKSWQQVPSGTGEDLVTLWGTGPDHIIAVGGRANGIGVTYDGTSWTAQSLAPLEALNGVFIERPDEAIVVGVLGSAASLNPDTFEFTPEETPTTLTLHAVWGDGGGTYYAVGGRNTGVPYQGVVIQRTTP